MMMFETEGRCPLCKDSSGIGSVMDHRTFLTCDGKCYTFPYRVYYCFWHGWFVWRGKKGHQLIDFSKLKHEAIEVEPLPSESPDTSAIADYSIVKMKCPYCEDEWEQYDKTWTTQDGCVICPSCGAKIPKGKAVVKR